MRNKLGKKWNYANFDLTGQKEKRRESFSMMAGTLI